MPAYMLADHLANLSSGQIKVGSSAANLSGTIDLKGAKPQINAHIDAASLAVSDIESVLPALGIVLPPGAKLEGGTASVKATAVGPADALIIKGHVRLTNSKLTGYDLASKLSDITRFSGITVGKETVIQEFSADVLHRSTGSKMDNVLIVLPGLARLTGAGTVGPQNDLNFAMEARVDISKSAVGDDWLGLRPQEQPLSTSRSISPERPGIPSSRPIAAMYRLSSPPEASPEARGRECRD